MATKTISVSLEAYDRLAAARVTERESFSKVICRAIWPAKEGTARDLVERTKSVDSKADLALLDSAQEKDEPTPDPWES